jgi:hypothetical protein
MVSVGGVRHEAVEARACRSDVGGAPFLEMTTVTPRPIPQHTRAANDGPDINGELRSILYPPHLGEPPNPSPVPRHRPARRAWTTRPRRTPPVVSRQLEWAALLAYLSICAFVLVTVWRLFEWLS